MYSFQTNVTSLFAQNNLRVNSDFQSQTISRLTSGYRINASGDDAAGLAVANKFRSDVAELTQGVRNANDGISTLQIVDGGLNNISKTLDRLKTLATQSASGTFTGDRTVLNNEYQTLIGEISRQASNIGLNAGGVNNTTIGVYVGGGYSQATSQVQIDLSGNSNQVDATGLGVNATTISGTVGGTNISTSADLRSGTYLAGNSTQGFKLDLANGQSVNLQLDGGTSGLTGDQVISSLNSQLSAYGITASKDATSGKLTLTSATAFVFETSTSVGSGTAVATSNSQVNSSEYSFNAGALTASTGAAQTISITPTGGSAINVTVATTDTATTLLSKFNNALSGSGVSAVKDSTGNVVFQSAQAFTLSRGNDAATGGGLANLGTASTSASITAPAQAGSATDNALAALTSIKNAIAYLGKVQGKVGTGENDLQSAIALAQSQITNFSAAESRIRDADVAAEAANLTKAQVLQQASVAALAQANSAPQAVLSLLK